jgi:hypothetical protein
MKKKKKIITIGSLLTAITLIIAGCNTGGGKPAAPDGAAASSNSETSVLIQWNDNSDNETGFTIERSSSASGTFTEAGTAAADAVQYTDTGLTTGTEYYYRVAAYNEGGMSPYTAVVSAVPSESGGDTSQAEELASSISTDTTLVNRIADNSAADYFASGDVTVTAALTIEAGVIIAFDEDVLLSIGTGGSIDANGTESEGILMTSSRASENIKWAGLNITSTSTLNSLDYVTIRHAGGDAASYVNSDWRAGSIMLEDEGTLSITNSTITDSDAYGLYLDDNAVLGTFSSNTFSDNTGEPAVIPFNQIGALDSGTTFSGNGHDGVSIYRSTLSDEQTAPALSTGSEYLVIGEIAVAGKLTIQEGARFVFNEDQNLLVESTGSLNAVGTADAMIVFTSSDIAGGIKWGGIGFESTSTLNELDYVEVSHGGGHDHYYVNSDWRAGNIVLDEGHLKLTNSTVSESGSHGLWVDPDSDLTAFSGNTFTNNTDEAAAIPFNDIGIIDGASTYTGNGHDGVSVYGSTMVDDQTAAKLSGTAAYKVLSDIYTEAAFTIEAGTGFVFAEDTWLEVKAGGSLVSAGTSGNEIVFTSVDEAGGILWGGIGILSSSALNEISYTTVKYAGGHEGYYVGSDWRASAIVLEESSAVLTLENSTVSNSGSHGLIVENGGEVNGLTAADASPETTVEGANTFTGNGNTDVVFY